MKKLLSVLLCLLLVIGVLVSCDLTDKNRNSSRSTSEDSETEDGTTEDNKTENGKTEDGKTENNKTENNKTENNKTEDNKTENNSPEENKPQEKQGNIYGLLSNKTIVEYVYDEQGRMIMIMPLNPSALISYDYGAFRNIGVSVSGFVYGEDGRVTGVRSGISIMPVEYDVDGSATCSGMLVEFSYHKNGTVAEMCIKQGNQSMVYRFAENGVCLQISRKSGEIVTAAEEFSYENNRVSYKKIDSQGTATTACVMETDEQGRPSCYIVPSKTETRYTWKDDQLVRVTQSAATQDGEDFVEQVYVDLIYDDNGKLVRIDICMPDGTLMERSLYSYDQNGLLTQEQDCRADGTVMYEFNYHYDENGVCVSYTMIYKGEGEPYHTQEKIPYYG